MRRKHSNKRVCLNCKIRKKLAGNCMSFLPIWADFGGQSCKRIRSSQSKSHWTFNNNKCTVPKQFDLKLYPRSLKLEDPPKVTRDANLHARQRHTNNNPKSFITWIQKHRILIGHFRVPKPSLSKWGQAQNLSCENEFYLHENEKSFPYQRLST